MESYPRQCRADGQTFVEKIPEAPSTLFNECTDSEREVQACTKEYNPVCGVVDNGIRCIKAPCPSTDAKTFGNACTACSSQAYGYYLGACEGRLFVVCGETVTGFDPKQFALENGAICVDICPKNYDAYNTQIGVELCIPHYGVEEIEQWPTCARSSASCECVKAYETTTGEQIENPGYHCVPQQYAERLLFRGGQERLDENGVQSAIIA
jgi:hypothetical protein